MDDHDFERLKEKILEILPQLSPNKTQAVIERVDELGVTEESDLQLITEEDLLSGGILKLVEARKLILYWHRSSASSGTLSLLLLYSLCY